MFLITSCLQGAMVNPAKKCAGQLEIDYSNFYHFDIERPETRSVSYIAEQLKTRLSLDRNFQTQLDDYYFCVGLVKHINQRCPVSHETIAYCLGVDNNIGAMKKLFYVQELEKVKLGLSHYVGDAKSNFYDTYRALYGSFDENAINESIDFDWQYFTHSMKHNDGTLLELSIQKGCQNIGKILATQQYDISRPASSGFTPLMIAKGESFDFLLKNYRNVINIDQKSYHGKTILHHLLGLYQCSYPWEKSDIEEKIKKLLSCGAHPDITNDEGFSADDIARNHKWNSIVELFDSYKNVSCQ